MGLYAHRTAHHSVQHLAQSADVGTSSTGDRPTGTPSLPVAPVDLDLEAQAPTANSPTTFVQGAYISLFVVDEPLSLNISS